MVAWDCLLLFFFSCFHSYCAQANKINVNGGYLWSLKENLSSEKKNGGLPLLTSENTVCRPVSGFSTFRINVLEQTCGSGIRPFFDFSDMHTCSRSFSLKIPQSEKGKQNFDEVFKSNPVLSAVEAQMSQCDTLMEVFLCSSAKHSLFFFFFFQTSGTPSHLNFVYPQTLHCYKSTGYGRIEK